MKSITDNPADLERELRAFAQTGEDWRQKSMTLEQENEAIRKKLHKVTKELEKVKKAAAFEIGNFNDAEDHKAILKAIVGSWRRLHRPRLCTLQGRGTLRGSPGACLDGRPVRAR